MCTSWSFCPDCIFRMRVLIFSHTFPRFEGDNSAPFMGNLANSLHKRVKDLFVFIPYDPKIKKDRGYKIKTFKYAFFDRFHLLGYSRTLQDDKKLRWYVNLLAPLYILFGFISLLKLVISKYNLLENDFIVLAVGRLVQKKGFIYLIRAARNLKEKIRNFKLVIVGDGNQRVLLEKECAKYNLSNEVIFTGMIDYTALTKYYNLADVFVMPSIRDDSGNIDASPVALMEAMLSGLMVVTTEGTIDESLRKRNKFLKFVKERNPEQITRSVGELYKLSKTSKSKLDIRQLIRRTSIAQFSSDSVADRYIKLFKESIS